MGIRELIRDCKERGFKTTNNLLGVSFLEEIDKKDNLDVVELTNGLLFFDTSQNPTHLYYYLNLALNIDVENLFDKSNIIEIIDKNSKPRNDKQIKYWINNKFRVLSKNYEMILDCPVKDFKQKIELQIPNEDDYKSVISLYETGLNPMINSFPTLEVFLKLINNREIYVYKNNDKVIASITKKTFSNHYLISHIVVDSKFRGLGLGVTMISTVLKDVNKKVLLWVSEDNLNAIRIYKKLGFEYTDKISIQLIGGK